MSGRKSKAAAKRAGAANDAHVSEHSVANVAKADAVNAKRQFQMWASETASAAHSTSLRKFKVPETVVNVINKYPDDFILAAYGARLIEMSLSPPSVVLPTAEVLTVVGQVPNFCEWIAERLAKPTVTFSEKYSLLISLTQTLLTTTFSHRKFISAKPSILDTVLSLVEITGEHVKADFNKQQYPFDIIAGRFGMDPTTKEGKDRASALFHNFAETIRQGAADMLGKAFRLFASRLAEDDKVLLDSIKSVPKLMHRLLAGAMRPIPKHLPHSMVSSTCATTIAVLLNVPFRESENEDPEDELPVISDSTMERFNYLLEQTDDYWLDKLMDFVRPGPTDIFDQLMEQIAQCVTPDGLRKANLTPGMASTASQGALKNIKELILGLFSTLLNVATVPSAAEAHPRLLPMFRGGLTRVFHDFTALKQNGDKKAQARIHMFMENQAHKNVYDAEGNVIVVSTLFEPVVTCALGLFRLCKAGVFDLNEFEMFLAPVGGIHAYFIASAQKAKQAGNDAYSEALKSNKSALEAAAAMYTMAVALSMPDDPERHIYFSNRAQVWIERKMWKDAIQDCIKALSIDPTHGKSKSRLEIATKGLEELSSKN